MVLKNSDEMVIARDSNENGNSSTVMEENLNKNQLTYGCSYGPFVMPVISIPKVEEQNSKASIVLSGTARKGEVGPAVGAVDIGISKSAYFFQVALPGVKKDPGVLSNFFISRVLSVLFVCDFIWG